MPSPDHQPVLEREAELALIAHALAAARDRAGGPLLVIGPAGIGKTTLLSMARELAVHRGFCVLEARASSLEEDFSFGVARQLFERMLADAGRRRRDRLLAGAARGAMIALEGAAVGTVSDLDRRFAAVHGLYWLAVIVAERQPLLLSVDDLHWADRASLRWIAYLAGRLADLPIALMLSWRQGEVMPGDDSLARVEEVAGSQRLEPAALSRDAARELLAHRLERSPGERVVHAAHSVCGGNPFLLGHVGEALLAEPAADEDAAVEWVQQLGPPGVTRFVRLRIGRLGEDACRLADALAVLGDEAQLRHVAELCDFQLQRAALAADKLAGIGVWGPGTSLRYIHAIVRSAVYAGMPTAQRSLLHARAAKVLARDAADLDRVCSHLLLAEPAGSAEVAVQLRTAAARAARCGALESASAYLSRALQETADPGLRLELLHELGRVEQVMRDPRAATHLREALELADDPRRSAVVASDLSHVLLMDGRWVESFSMLQRARRALEATDSPRRDDALSVQLEATWAYFAAYDPELVGQFDLSVQRLLAKAVETDPVMRPLAAILAGILGWRGEPTVQVLALVEHALRDQRWLEWVESSSALVAQVCLALAFTGALDRTEALIHELVARSRERGSVIAAALAAYLRTMVRSSRGDLTGAEADLGLVCGLAQESHELRFALPTALYFAVDVLIERDHSGEFAALTEGIELTAGLATTASGAALNELRGRLALAKREPAALGQLRRASELYASLQFVNPNWSAWRSALALALPVEQRTDAVELATSELHDAQRLGLPRATGVALRTIGVLESGENGLRYLRSAVDVLRTSGARLEHAKALVELGAALRRDSRRIDARECLREGLDLAYRCGALRLQERARAELKTSGARPRRLALSGAEALTPSERRVAELAAEGLTNREIAQELFITTKTVKAHLSHVYLKLDISRRGELTTALDGPGHQRT